MKKHCYHYKINKKSSIFKFHKHFRLVWICMINPKWCIIQSLQSWKFIHVLSSSIHEYLPYLKRKWNEIWYEEFLANFISKSNHDEKLNRYKYIQPLLGLRHALRSGPLPPFKFFHQNIPIIPSSKKTLKLAENEWKACGWSLCKRLECFQTYEKSKKSEKTKSGSSNFVTRLSQAFFQKSMVGNSVLKLFGFSINMNCPKPNPYIVNFASFSLKWQERFFAWKLKIEKQTKN